MPDASTLTPFSAAFAALQLHLQRFFPPAQFQFRLVPDSATPAQWMDLTSRTPFVGLSWGGITPAAGSGRDLAGSCNWGLMLVTRHSEITKRYLGDGTMPALMDMAWIASLALNGHKLVTPDGLNLGTVRVSGPVDVAAPQWGENLAQATVHFTTPLPTAGDAYVGDLAEFLTLGVTWDFPALAAATDEMERPA